MNPLLQIGTLCIGDKPCPPSAGLRRDNENVRRTPHDHHGHKPDDHSKIVVSGSDDNVNVHSRSPHRNHHHYDVHERVIVTGDHDNVKTHSRRTTDSTLLMDKNRMILVDSLARRHDRPDYHHGRSVPMQTKRDDPFAGEGVPGNVDIMVRVRPAHFTRSTYRVHRVPWPVQPKANVSPLSLSQTPLVTTSPAT